MIKTLFVVVVKGHINIINKKKQTPELGWTKLNYSSNSHRPVWQQRGNNNEFWSASSTTLKNKTWKGFI